jgi:uncharacterized protein YgbK (DUF1537 family)
LTQTPLTLGDACVNLKLLTGGSGIALGLPLNLTRGDSDAPAGHAGSWPVVHGHAVVLAGSASSATLAQIALWRKSRPSFRLDPRELMRGEPVVTRAIEFALSKAEPVLIYASTTPDEVKAVQREFGVAQAGTVIEAALSTIARDPRDAGFRKFVVAGGGGRDLRCRRAGA